MPNYLLLQGKFSERNESDELQHASHIARRRGPDAMLGSCIEEFTQAFYDVTWMGEFNALKKDEDVLEELFEEFNINHPAGFKSYSMSVGDMVNLDGRLYHCAPVGWTRVN